MERPPAYKDAYPEALWEHERAQLRARMPERHRELDDRPSDQVVGSDDEAVKVVSRNEGAVYSAEL